MTVIPFDFLSSMKRNAMELNHKPWYDRPFLVYLVIVLFFPLGLYALWKSEAIRRSWKIAISLFVGLLLVRSFGSNEDRSELLQSKIQEAPVLVLNEDSVAQVRKAEQSKRINSSKITANYLYQEFQVNQIKAESKFKDKYLYVEGTVSDFGRDILGAAYVKLKTNRYGSKLMCYPEDEDVLIELSKGQKVLFRGKCDGITLDIVGLRKCSLIKM